MSDDLLEDLRAVLALVDPVPAAVRHAADTVLHRPEEAESATAAVRYPFDRVVGMGYFPNELGLPVAPPAHAKDPPGDA
jgi:hypothetical protein